MDEKGNQLRRMLAEREDLHDPSAFKIWIEQMSQEQRFLLS